MKNMKNIQMTKIPRGGGYRPALLGRLPKTHKAHGANMSLII